MRRHRLTWVTALVLVWGATLGGATAIATTAGEASRRLSMAPATAADDLSFIVQLMDPEHASRAAELATRGHVRMRRIGSTTFRVVQASSSAQRRTLEKAMRSVGVAVEPNYYVRQTTVIAPQVDPNDPKVPSEPYLTTMRAPSAWAVPLGHGQPTLAVVDTGVSPHQEFGTRLLPGYNALTGATGVNAATDDNGHGTLVAGISAAKGNDGLGIAGIAWTAKVLPVKVLDSSGRGTVADVAEGVTWATSHGAKVINLSLGTVFSSSVLKAAVDDAFSHGVVVVASAGNTGDTTPNYPAAYPNVIAVGAVDDRGSGAAPYAWFSTRGSWVSISAPGVDVIGPTVPGDSYATASGTSVAAPFVAAAAVLVAAKYPTWTPSQIATRLTASAFDDVGPPGRDDETGAGELDLYAALGGLPAAAGASQPAYDEGSPPDDTSATARSLALGQPVTGSISPEGDRDWYKATLTAGSTYTVSAQPSSGAGHTDDGRSVALAVDVYDPTLMNLTEAAATPPGLGEWVPPGTVGPGVAAVKFATRSSGVHFFRVLNTTFTQSIGNYQITLTRGGTGLVAPRQFKRFQLYSANGLNVASVAAGDVTGDGRQDVLATTYRFLDGSVRPALLLYSQASNHFLSAPVSLPTDDGKTRANPQPQLAIGVGDLTGDVAADVAVATSEGVDIFRQNGGTLDPATLVPLPGPAEGLAVRDTDGDGRLDIVTYVTPAAADGQHFPGGLYLLHNTGSGFTSSRISAATSLFGAPAVGDLNGDGRVDIAAWQSGLRPNGDPGRLLVLQQSSSHTWATRYYASALDMTALTVGDVTGDRVNDLVFVRGGNYPDASMNVLPGIAGGLGTNRSTVTRDIPSAVALADLNADGRLDVATANSGWGMATHLQQPDGTPGPVLAFDPPVGGSNSYQPSDLAVADVTGDSVPDVVVGDDNGGLEVLPGAPYLDAPLSVRWLKAANPPGDQPGVSVAVQPSVTFGRAMDPATISTNSVRLLDGRTGSVVPASVTFSATSNTATVHPGAALAPGTAYQVDVTTAVADTTAHHPAEFRLAFLTGGSSVPLAAPTALTVAKGSTPGTVTVHWNPPPANGSDPPRMYTIAATTGGAVESVAASTTTATITGLTSGVSYRFQVEGTNPAGGFGAWSTSSAAITAP